MIAFVRKVLSLLDRRGHIQLVLLCSVMAFVALVQTVGIASVLPFMNAASNPSLITESRWLSLLYERGGFESTRRFLLFAGIALLVIMALSNALAAFETWLISRFSYAKQHGLSVRLLGQYLDEPYTFFLANNNSTLAKNVLIDATDIITGVITPGLRLISQALVIVFVTSLLFVVDYTVALAAIGILGGGYALIYVAVRRKLVQIGAARVVAHEDRFRAVNEALGSIKETKILGRERHFQRRFQDGNWRYAQTSYWTGVVTTLPRFALETLAFGGIVGIALYLIQTRQDFGEAVAVMSLYAFAAYRLMPALQQVFRSLAEIRFYTPAVESLYQSQHRRKSRSAPAPDTAKTRALGFEHQIVFDSIRFQYPGTDQPVLKGIDFAIPKNGSVAFVGSTGSGKTTLLDILLGLLEPQSGSIRVDDVKIRPEDIAAWQRLLGYVPQAIYLADDSIRRNIAFGLTDEEIDLAAVERAARIANLHDFVSSLPDGYDTEVGDRGVRLSGGQRQRVGIARALYRDPEILVMDEATSALDGMTEEAVIQAINDISKKKTMVIVAHRLTTVRDCDVIYLLDRGELVASGTYQELMRSNLMFRSMARAGVEEAPAV